MDNDRLAEMVRTKIEENLSIAFSKLYENVDQEWFMSKLKMSYIAVPLHMANSKRAELLELPYRDKNQLLMPHSSHAHDYLVYSLVYERYSYNSKEVLDNAPINIHHCKDADEFIAYMSASALNADLSGLWSIL